MRGRLALVTAAAAIAFSKCGGDTQTPTGPAQASASPQPTSPGPAPSATPQCNAALWDHVYDPSRLRIVDTCRTVTGVITDQHTNDDGDIDVRLALDPPYANLVNAGNVSNLNGHLQTEAICQAAIQTADASNACAGLNGAVRVPPDGTHVQVTGTYVLDLLHGWMEIHPISVLTVIP
jgi:hypothetical protein